MHDFQAISVMDKSLRPECARDDLSITFDSHAVAAQLEQADQLLHGAAAGAFERTRPAVDLKLKRHAGHADF